MLKIKKLSMILVAATGLFLAACQPQTTDLVAPPPSQAVEALPTAAVALEIEDDHTLQPGPEIITLSPHLTPIAFTKTLVPGEAIIYELNGTAGQFLDVRLDRRAGTVDLSLLAPDFSVIKANQDPAMSWQGIMPLTGLYQIRLAAGAEPTEVDFHVAVLETTWLAEDYSKILIPFSQGQFEVRFRGQAVDQTYFLADKIVLNALAGERSYELTIPQPSPIPLAFPQAVLVTDMNADGLLDFGLLAIIGPAGELFYNAWLYDGTLDQFILNDDMRLITTPRFINGGLVESFFYADEETITREVYAWDGDLLEKTLEETCQVGRDGIAKHRAVLISSAGEAELFQAAGRECPHFGQTDPTLAAAEIDNLAQADEAVVEAADPEPASVVNPAETDGAISISVDLIQGIDQLLLAGQWADDKQTLYQIDQISLQESGQTRQTLVIENSDPVPLTDNLAVQIEDFNYDGLPDLGLLKLVGANGNNYYDIFLYNPVEAAFEHNSELSALSTPEILGDFALRSTYRDDSAGQVAEIYEWAGSQLRLLVRETCQPTAEGTFVHTGFQFSDTRAPEQTFQAEGDECVEFGVFE